MFPELKYEEDPLNTVFIPTFVSTWYAWGIIIAVGTTIFVCLTHGYRNRLKIKKEPQFDSRLSLRGTYSNFKVVIK